MVGTDSGRDGGFYAQNSGSPQPASSSFPNAPQMLQGLSGVNGFSCGGYNSQLHRGDRFFQPEPDRQAVSSSHSSQMNANGQFSFGGSRTDVQLPREDDADEMDNDTMENDMMRMLLGESDDPAGTGQQNVANVMITNASNTQPDLLLVQEWIRESMPGEEGVASKFRSEVCACACACAHALCVLSVCLVSSACVPGVRGAMMI